MFSKESLERLRQRVDLPEVLATHLDLKRSGATYKGLCPFHDEKTPSFVIQKGDRHYHCFGCGAHGDAIQFLMQHVKLSFKDAVESLAERFQVPLERVEMEQTTTGPNKSELKRALELACNFYHTLLLHTPEGHEALHYLAERGIDLAFIRTFRLGFAPKRAGAFTQFMYGHQVSDAVLVAAGLVAENDGRRREFFLERITIPIHAASGDVIGFSARKFREETFGGKYVNTPETPLFKKSRVLFGLNYSRRRIAKERKAIIVEGQIDALRLIHAGLNCVVAGQGTAFGEGHVQELMQLGITHAFLAMDPDTAGQEATSKVGNLLQRRGIEVTVVKMPPGRDPDAVVRQEGIDAFVQKLTEGEGYLEFLVRYRSRGLDLSSPAQKNQVVAAIAAQIRSWENPLMVHESLRVLAHLAHVPEHIIGVGQEQIPNLYVKQSGSAGTQEIDPDRISEMNFLRALFLFSEGSTLAANNLNPSDLRCNACQQVYNAFLQNLQNLDILTLASHLDNEGQRILEEILAAKKKDCSKERAEEHLKANIHQILTRNWMLQREKVRIRLQTETHTDEEALELAKEFDRLRENPPKLREAQS